MLEAISSETKNTFWWAYSSTDTAEEGYLYTIKRIRKPKSKENKASKKSQYRITKEFKQLKINGQYTQWKYKEEKKERNRRNIWNKNGWEFPLKLMSDTKPDWGISENHK